MVTRVFVTLLDFIFTFDRSGVAYASFSTYCFSSTHPPCFHDIVRGGGREVYFSHDVAFSRVFGCRTKTSLLATNRLCCFLVV